MLSILACYNGDQFDFQQRSVQPRTLGRRYVYMPRGPFDEEIDTPEPNGDHARKRRDEFLKKRYPGGIPVEQRKELPKGETDRPRRDNEQDRKRPR